MKLFSKRIAKQLLVFTLLAGGLVFARFILAADFGTNEVSAGLNGSLATGDPRTIIGRIINIALGFLGVIALGLILYSGFLWMTSAGNEEKIATAKQILRNGIIGLVIILAAWAIATFILTKLGGAINGGSGGCTDGATQSCGCGGSMMCGGGSWGSCIGSSLQNCITPPTSCDSSPNPGCQAVNQICIAGDYCDNNCQCQPQGVAGESCDGDLTNLTCDVDNTRCSEFLTCNPDTCLCAGPPVITGISPAGGFCNANSNKPCASNQDCAVNDTCNLTVPNGAISNFITIFGKNFGEYSATSSKLIFLGSGSPKDAIQPQTINPSCINTWRDDQIVVAVSPGAQSGPIKIINSEGLTDSTNDAYGPQLADFVVNNIDRPGLCFLSPKQGRLRAEVNYQGNNLYSSDAYFGNYQSNVKALSSNFAVATGLSGTSTTPNIQAGVTGSFVEKNIAGFTQKSNFLKFTKDREEGEGPYIISFSPTEGSVGQYVTIKGAGFGGAQGSNHVYFLSGNNKIEASYLFPAICANSVWKDNQIIVKVPDLLVDDSYQIQITLGALTINTENLNPNAFNFNKTLALKTSVCKIDPTQGPIDTPVTLWGEYFGTIGSNALVKFNYNQDITGVIKKENDANAVTVNVPAAAKTGPVRVVKNGTWGNELNFSVGECTKNEECNNQICCPSTTYKKGRCVNNLNECFVDIPTSVFEWTFSTNFDATTTQTFDSCLGLSKYLGTCYQGGMCPNSPGSCSSPATSYQKVVGSCDSTCQSAPGCTNDCTYLSDLDKCQKNAGGSNPAFNGTCDLSKSVTFPASAFSGKLTSSLTTDETCNSAGNWEIATQTSCPIGWTSTPGNHCTQDGSNCRLCPDKFNCENVSSVGRCVSDKLCADNDAKCVKNPIATLADNCILEVKPSCDCCCRIGKDAEDCCAPLTCAGKCGSDIINNSNTFGKCSGCAAAGSTTEEHDAACNCTGHTSQFCDINSDHPQGVCSDCANISSQTNCGDHSSSCCFDSNRTATTTDDVCRGLDGGGVVSKTKGNADYGYCAYYNCFSNSVPPIGDPKVCASTTPLRIGFFDKIDTCVGGCPKGIGSDPCRAYDKDQPSCSNESACCYDSTTKNCLSGNKITSGANSGYCAYYQCQTPPGNPLLCDILTPTTTPIFASTSSCATSCANPPGGAGLGCADLNATSTCNFGLCNFPGLACLQDSGLQGAYPSCGTCCCQVGLNPDSCVSSTTPSLHCQADKGSCSGAGRGLCCGCSSDLDCGSISTTGCGSDTCCTARPTVVSTLPKAESNNICRNAGIKVSFNQSMDVTSFGNNFLLLEERDFGNGVCPAGTFITDSREIENIINPPSKNIFARLWKNIALRSQRIFSKTSETALAVPPSASKLYCSVPGSLSAEENGSQTDLIFMPTKLLAPATKYYAVIKGDETLNSQSGIISFSGVGLNERGFNTGSTFLPSNQIKFNNRAYLNSYSFQFITLPDQGANAGICAIDYVSVNPFSYLFKTTTNDLNENDTNVNSSSFDKTADRDKAFTAGAYSSNNQLLHPVVGYAWNWVWSSDNLSIARVVDLNSPIAPPTIIADKKLIVAQPNITDGQAKINATVNMSNYRTACGANCNSYFVGDGETNFADVYTFICNNPWPAVASNGTWQPWRDVAGNCSYNNVNCENYNYKFYYCRDAGGPGTLDDLPAIISSPVANGQGTNLLCSSDKTPCSAIDARCGADQNGDGTADGICVWNVLKESFFFRATILPAAEIISATDTGGNGEVQVNWRSPASGASSYKIYYLKSGKGTMYSKEVAVAGACVLSGQNYNCNTKINDLVNGQPYVFKLSVISVNKTESALSSEQTATPSDQTKASRPIGLKAAIATTTVTFSWQANPTSDKVSFYRLYRGIASGVYGESFDSALNSTSLTFEQSQFAPTSTLDYFALTAVNSSNHESDKSAQVVLDLRN